jgi:hypothetical protein
VSTHFLVTCGIHEKGWVAVNFQKEPTLYGNSNYQKEEGRPYYFAKASVQKIRDMDTKWSRLANLPQSSKTVFMNTEKTVESLDRLFPEFSLY